MSFFAIKENEKNSGQKSFPYWLFTGDCFLHHERLFPRRKGHKDLLHTDRCAARHVGGDGGKRGAGGEDDVRLRKPWH